MHDDYSFAFLLRSIDLVWPTRLIYLAMGKCACDGFDLAVLNPSDRRGHDTYVSLLLKVKGGVYSYVRLSCLHHATLLKVLLRSL